MWQETCCPVFPSQKTDSVDKAAIGDIFCGGKYPPETTVKEE